MTKLPSVAEAAVAYAGAGHPVIVLYSVTPAGHCRCRLGAECSSPGKHPRTVHGLKDSTTDLEVIDSWLARWPASNIGLLTGVAFDVLDVDGDEALKALADIAGGRPLGCGPIARTGHGWHYLVAPTGKGNRARLLDGVDYRGVGGYMVAPPSQHVTGRRYRWVVGLDVPIEPAPAWLAQLIDPPPPPRNTGPWKPPSDERARSYGASALHAEAECVAGAPKGQRNDCLNRSAFRVGQLVAGGVIDADRATEVLLSAAVFAGLGEPEALTTIRSGLQAGQEHPR